ncbi:MAG: glycerol-3-phosphate acyltransferase [Chloroflexota bacterium]
MVIAEYADYPRLLAALAVGYLLGSIPFAYLAARLRGVDIFSTGSRRAGTANVFWNVGRRTGTLVFVGDVAKGSAAVVVAGLLDMPWFFTLLAGGAAVLGHWNSVFLGFRGGDGMATLLGVVVALEPTLTVLGVIGGMAVVLLLRRSPSRSSWGIVSCAAIMLSGSQYYQIDPELIMGLVALAMLVVFHSVAFRRRVRPSDVEPDAALDLQLDRDPDLDLEPAPDSNPELGAPTPESR